MPLDVDEQLRRAADGPPTRLDVESLIVAGRRRRQRRQAGGVGAVVAAVALLAVVVVAPGGRTPIVAPIEPLPLPSVTDPGTEPCTGRR